MRIIVSLTSYPPRINSVHKVIESLYRQTVPADEIVLYLSLDEFPETKKDLPETLRSLNGRGGFRIAWVPGNLKSHKKYYYALQEYRDAVVITIDDDKRYAESMIEDLLRSHERFPDAVSARTARIMLKGPEGMEPYGRWENGKYLEEYRDVPRMDLCAIGVGGICYPPLAAKEEWFREEIITGKAGEHDDLWLKYNEIVSNIPVVYTKPSGEDITIENTQICSLAANNLYGSGNDECIRRLLALLRGQDAGCYQKWFRSLMTWEAYLTAKKKYYAEAFRRVFDQTGAMPVYFYGAGIIAHRLSMVLADLGLLQRITAVIVSDQAKNPASLQGLPVRALSELEADRQFAVILGVNEAHNKEIRKRLAAYACQEMELDMRIIARYYQC